MISDSHKQSERKQDVVVPPTNSTGLQCPKCHCRHFLNNPVLESRRTTYVEDGIRRVRYCRNCGYAIVTVERRV